MRKIKTKTIKSKNVGPKVVFLGGIHGNETCGKKGMDMFLDKIKSREIKIKSGSITLIPVCNHVAFKKKVRFIDRDLNRVFEKTKKPKYIEQVLANEITTIIDENDIMVDIHSTETSGKTNIFVDYPKQKNIHLAEAMPFSKVIIGWPEAYKKSGVSKLDKTTESYAHKTGKIGVLVECGQHDDPEAVKLAFKAICATLGHYKMINYKIKKRSQTIIRMTKVFVKENINDRFISRWKHLDKVKRGSPIAERANGGKIVVKKDCFIILPKHNARPGKEWFYTGIEVKNRQHRSI